MLKENYDFGTLYIRQTHEMLSQASRDFIKQDSLYTYGLGHAAYHYVVLGDSQKKGVLLQDEHYRKKQYQRSGQFDWGYQALRYGLALCFQKWRDSRR